MQRRVSYIAVCRIRNLTKASFSVRVTPLIVVSLRVFPPSDPRLTYKPKKAGRSVTGALTQHPNLQHDPQPPPIRGSIHEVPFEILTKIFEFLVPPSTRSDVDTLINLTHVCHFWMDVLIKQRRAWATIFFTHHKDPDRNNYHQHFINTCLERSNPVPLEVTVDIRNLGLLYLFFHNERPPMLITDAQKSSERDVTPETHVKEDHWERIRTLNLRLDKNLGPQTFPMSLDLPWFPLPFPPTSFPPHRFWSLELVMINTLTSFTFSYPYTIPTEMFRTFILNNKSLEGLSVDKIALIGRRLDQPPVILPNLKSLSLVHPTRAFSALIHVPALQRLSSLLVTVTGNGNFNLYATGDEIVFNVACKPSGYNVANTWMRFTKRANPTIRRVRLENPGYSKYPGHETAGMVSKIFKDAHILEIGSGFTPDLFPMLWNDLKKLRSQLSTIRFGVSGKFWEREAED